jgi:hypothetical protein
MVEQAALTPIGPAANPVWHAPCQRGRSQNNQKFFASFF